MSSPLFVRAGNALNLTPEQMLHVEQLLAAESEQRTGRAAQKRECLHGALRPSVAAEAGLLEAVPAYLQSISSVPNVSNMPRLAASSWLLRNWSGLNALQQREFIPIIRSMAADAALDEKEPALRHFCEAALWAETYAAEGALVPKVTATSMASNDCVRETPECAAALENSRTMRRYLSQKLSCSCFSPAYASRCGLPGCEKLHTPYGASPQKLLKCSRCKSAYYCSDAHIAQHWPQHKAECRRIAAAAAAAGTA
jgi:MYND finger